MNELRWNPLANRWSVLAPGRADRPHHGAPTGPRSGDGVCPFCPGNEYLTPPSLVEEGGPWAARVVPNRYPAFDPGATPDPAGAARPSFTGIATRSVPAHGRHEVLVLGRDHDRAFHDLDDHTLECAGRAVSARLASHAADDAAVVTEVFVNQGVAGGASLPHPHLQLTALPVVPPVAADEVCALGSAGSCALCIAVPAERAAGERLVFDRGATVALCPYWSSASFEVLVAPVEHGAAPSSWPDALSALRDAAALVATRHPDVAYNVFLHLGLLREPRHGFHWHGHVVPRLGALAGFELATGMGIATVRPEEAATELRRAGGG